MKTFTLYLLLSCTLLFGRGFTHFPMKAVTAGSVHTLSLTAESANRVYVHYRTNIADDYRVVEMEQTGYQYQSDIKIPEKNAHELDYFFSVVHLNGAVETFPSELPDENPYKSRILAYQEDINFNYEIISPLENEVIDPEDFMVAVSLFDSSNQIDVKKTRIYVNDVELTSQADLSEELISVVPASNLSLGRTKLKVQLFNAAGKQLKSVEWMATLRSGLNEAASAFALHGSLSFDNRSETVGVDEASDNFFNGNAYLYGNVSSMRVFGKARISSEQSDTRQNVNRFTAGAESELFKVHIGDVSPDYHPLILQNRYARGFQAGLYFGFLNFDYASGNMNKEITANSVENITGFFERKMVSGRVSFGQRGDAFYLGISALKTKDQDINAGTDTAMVNASLAQFGKDPEENFAVGVDLGTSLFNNRFKLNVGGAVSVLSENIRGGTIPYDTLNNLIEDFSLSEDDYDRINKVITIAGIPTFDYSFFGDVSLNAFNNYLKVKFEQVNPNFRTHGQPYLNTDIRRISIYDRIRLFENQVFLTIQGRFQSNNVDDAEGTDTRSINSLSYGVTYYPLANLPSITARMGSVDQSTDAKETNERNTNSFNFDINQQFELASMVHRGTFSIGKRKTEITNSASTVVSAEGNDMLLSLKSNFSTFPLTTFVQYSTLESITLTNDPVTTNEFTIRGEYELSQFVAGSNLNAFGQLNFASTKDMIDSKEVDLSQNAFEFGGRYRLPISATHTLTASASFRTVSFSGTTDFSNTYINLGAQYTF